MSFDLGFWYALEVPDDRGAGATYLRLLRGDTTGLPPCPTLKAFLLEITSRFPEIDDVDEEAADECPWTCAFDKSDCHLLLSMVWGVEDELRPWLLDAAHRHGLVCYDPQAGKAHVPSAG